MHESMRATLSHTLRHAPYLGHDEYERRLFGPAVERPCRLEYTRRHYLTPKGADILCHHRIMLDVDVPIKMSDQLTLPDGTQPHIVVIDAQYVLMEHEIDHYFVYYE